MTRTNPGIHSLAVGDFTVTALNDGQFEAPAAVVVGITPPELETAMRDAFRPFPPKITVNAFLVETGDRTILVDSGAGNKYGAALGAVGRRLTALGVGPDAIDTVLLTHAHIDHIGGLTDDAGAPLFPRAEVLLPAVEHAFWTSDEHLAGAPAEAQGAFHAARAVFKAYGSRLRLIEDGATVVPGITAEALPGHTPGHTGYRIASQGRDLLLWADIVHVPGVQFDKPEVGMGFDVDKALAVTTRKAIIDKVVAEGTLIGGMHLEFPTFAYLRRHAGRVEVVPALWTPAA